ncbi:disulfide bond formation protein B [Altererythrobacter sp. ZODW24]|uniref:disulfide bond formation protein B n=1 Tax=Altererythrobacter sp. ZODW24 TaxID=2185142 RepID=UPI000DF7797B|nr:disulfide bond formation protein B [Altererythrobacter sp. ZODW24]
MPDNSSLKLAKRLALVVPVLLLAGAYISQYGFGLYPCEMCWWQRWPHFAAVIFAALGMIAAPKRMWIALAAIGILVSGLIGGFHAGVEYGWWEGITGCTTTVPEGANALDAVINAPLVRCDRAPWDLLGVSLAGWNFIVSTGTAIAIFILLGKSK